MMKLRSMKSGYLTVPSVLAQFIQTCKALRHQVLGGACMRQLLQRRGPQCNYLGLQVAAIQ